MSSLCQFVSRLASLSISMIARKLLFVATIISLSPSAVADNSENLMEPWIDTVVPVASLANECVDVPPLNDGFGWNGMCTCSLPGSFKNFGRSIVTDGSGVVIGSNESPNTCRNSGSASVYRIQTDGSIEKEAEVVSSIQQPDDEFALSSSNIDLAGSYLAVGVRGSAFPVVDPSVTVFKYDGAVWNEIYVKNTLENRSLAFFGEELLVNDLTTLTRIRRDDGTLLQTISAECVSGGGNGFIDEYNRVEDTLAVLLSFCGGDRNNSETVVFRQDGSGNFVETQRLETGHYLSRMPDGRNLLIAFDNPVTSMMEADNGSWQSLEPLSRPPYGTGYRHNYEIYGGQVFLLQSTSYPDYIDTLRVYDLNIDGRWIEVQELNFSLGSPGYAKKLMFSGNKLTVVRSSSNVDDYRVMSASAAVFQKDSANRWAKLFEKDFTGDFQRDDTISSFTGDNLFLSVAVNEVNNVRLSQEYAPSADTATPDTVTPDTVTPDTVTPDTVLPDTVTPETIDDSSNSESVSDDVTNDSETSDGNPISNSQADLTDSGDSNAGSGGGSFSVMLLLALVMSRWFRSRRLKPRI